MLQIMKEDDNNWPLPDRVGRQELEVVMGNEHVSFNTTKLGSVLQVQQSKDPEGLRIFYYLVQVGAGSPCMHRAATPCLEVTALTCGFILSSHCQLSHAVSASSPAINAFLVLFHHHSHLEGTLGDTPAPLLLLFRTSSALSSPSSAHTSRSSRSRNDEKGG